MRVPQGDDRERKIERLRELIRDPLICDPPSPAWLECRRLMAETGVRIDFKRERVRLTYGEGRDHG